MVEKEKRESDRGGHRPVSLQLAIALLVVAAAVMSAVLYHFYRQKALPTTPAQRSDNLAKSPHFYGQEESSATPLKGGDVRAKIENALVVVDDTADRADPVGQALRRELLSECRIKAARYILGDPGDVTVRPMLAKVLLRLDQVEDAGRVVDDLLKLSPGLAEGLWLKGMIMRRRGDKGYVDLFKQAAESPQAGAEIWASYGDALYVAGQDQQAESYLAKALQAKRQIGKLTPRDTETLKQLGTLAMRGGELKRAADLLSEARQLAPSDTDIAFRLAESQRLFRRKGPTADTAKSKPGRWIRESVENAFAIAEEREDRGVPGTEAVSLKVFAEFQDIAAGYVRSNPGDVTVRPVLVRLLLRLGKVDDAQRVVDDLLKLVPSLAEGLWLKGVIMCSRQQDGYMKYFRLAADSPEADTEILETYGEALLAENRYDEAEGYLSKALETKRRTGDKTSAREADILYGLAKIDVHKAEFRLAAEHLREAARLAPSKLEIVQMLIEAHRRAGNLAQAEQTLKEANERFPKWVDQAALSMELGRIRQQQQKWLEAGDAFAQAAKHPKLGTEAAFEAAKCYHAAEKYSMAMEHIDAVIEVRPYDAEALEWMRKIEDARFPRLRQGT